MQTLYTKITRERSPAFQQMTKIFIDNGVRKVCKSSISQAGQTHINTMYANYKYFVSIGKDLLCHTEYKNDKLYFDFLNGKSMCNHLLDCVIEKDRDSFLKILCAYKKFVYNFGDEKELFHKNEEYKKVFGEVCPRQTVGARHLNIDLIFENLIEKNDHYSVIDFEWIFDFVIPYEFVFFRAIYSFFIKYSKELENFIKVDTVYDIFGISEEDISLFQQMDKNFLSYVYGSNYNYDNSLQNYKKQSYSLKKVFQKDVLFTQLFYDSGNGFSEELCVNQIIESIENDTVELIYTLPVGVSKVRLDPATNPVSMFLQTITVVDKEGCQKEITDFTTNADFEAYQYLIFKHQDPQIFICHSEEFIEIKFKFIYYTGNIQKMNESFINQIFYKYEHELNKAQKMNKIYKEIIDDLRKQ